MTFTFDATLIAVLAIIAGVAAFFAPRFLGLVVAAGLVLFGVFQLFPEVVNTDIGQTISNIDLDDIHIEDTSPADPTPETPS